MTPAASDPGPLEVERVIEDLVYEHLLALVDFERMNDLEQVVGARMEELFENVQLGDRATEDQLYVRASNILERAWRRVLQDPRRYAAVDDWNPDDDCQLCQALAHSALPAKPHRSMS